MKNIKVNTWYREKRRIRVFVPAVEMTAEERWVYSWLALAKRPLSRRRLATYTQVARTKTLPKVINKLAELRLAQEVGKKLQAVEPTPEQFPRWKEDPKWQATLRYDLVPVPSAACPLTLRQLLVFSLLHKHNHSNNKLARLLKFDRGTVRGAVNKLRSLGLINELGEPVRPTPETLAWFVDADASGKLVGARKGAGVPLQKTFTPMIDQLNDHFPMHDWGQMIRQTEAACLTAGYDLQKVVRLIDEMVKRFRKLSVVAGVVRQLKGLVEKAEERTQQNRRDGKFSGSNSFGLFKKMVLENSPKKRREG